MSPSRRAALLAAVPALALGGAAGPLTAQAKAPKAPTAHAQVKLQNIAFSPKRVVLKRGGKVTWTWLDEYSKHNVKSSGKPRFAGEGLKSSGTYTVRFKKAGTYKYVCTVHPGMTGTVVVR